MNASNSKLFVKLVLVLPNAYGATRRLQILHDGFDSRLLIAIAFDERTGRLLTRSSLHSQS